MKYTTKVSDFTDKTEEQASSSGELYEKLMSRLVSSPLGSMFFTTKLRDQDGNVLYEEGLFLISDMAKDTEGNVVLFFSQGSITIVLD